MATNHFRGAATIFLIGTFRAFAFSLSVTDPAAMDPSVPRDANIGAEFDEPLSNETVNASTFRVWGKQTGFKSGTFSFDPMTFDPNTSFKAGEEVVATWTTDILSAAGSPLQQRQLPFTARAGGAFPFRMSEQRDSGLGIGTRFAALGDLDNDGDLDVFGADFSVPIRVSLNDGHARFTPNGQNLSAMGCWRVELGDLDNDGDLDAFVARALNVQSQIYINDGTGHFTLSPQVVGGYSTVGVALGDLDGDGDLDIVTAEHGTIYATSHNWVLRNDGTGSFAQVQSLGSYANDVALGDLDLDGDLDIVLPGAATAVWYNDGSGFFSAGGQPAIDGTSIALGDLNGDHFPDVVVGGASNTVYLNDQSGAVAPTDQPMRFLFRPALADLDGDHDLDVVGASSGIWLNDGSGLFELGSFPVASNSEVRLGDFDGDGDLDVLKGGDADGFSISKVYLNKQGTDVAISKRASTNLALAGQTIMFTVTVYSVGATVATGVVVSDPLPGGLLFVSASSSVYDPTNGLWIIGDLPPGISTTLVMQTQVATNAANGLYTNVAALAAMDTPDTDTNDDQDGVVIELATALANLTLSVSGTPNPVAAGCRLTYTMQLVNQGPRDTTNVILLASLPTNVTLLSVLSTDLVCGVSNPVSCTMTQMTAGRTARVVVTVQPVSEGTATVTVATSSEGTKDLAPQDNAAAVTTVIAGTVVNGQEPALAAPAAPFISTDPAGAPQNNVGDAFDFSQAGVALHTVDQCGFGSLGQLYFNYDASRLYVGGLGLNPAGGNNAVVIFLGFNTLLSG